MPVVSLVKGLEQGTNTRMSQIVDEVLPGHPAGIFAGPNIAREVADGYAAAAVLAMPDQHLRGHAGRPVPHQAVSDVHHRRRGWRRRWQARLKNVYAIAVGMGYSLGIGENTARDGDRPCVAGNVQAGRGDGRAPRHVRRPGRHGRSDRHVHQPAQPQPSRRRTTGFGQDDRRDHRVDEPGRRGRQGRKRDHGVRRPTNTASTCRSRGRSTA